MNFRREGVSYKVSLARILSYQIPPSKSDLGAYIKEAADLFWIHGSSTCSRVEPLLPSVILQSFCTILFDVTTTDDVMTSFERNFSRRNVTVCPVYRPLLMNSIVSKMHKVAERRPQASQEMLLDSWLRYVILSCILASTRVRLLPVIDLNIRVGKKLMSYQEN